MRRGENRRTRGKTSRSRVKNQQPNLTHSRPEPGPRRWEASAITTTPSLLPQFPLFSPILAPLISPQFLKNLRCCVAWEEKQFSVTSNVLVRFTMPPFQLSFSPSFSFCFLAICDETFAKNKPNQYSPSGIHSLHSNFISHCK